MFARNITTFFICGACEKEIRAVFPNAILPFNEQSRRDGGQIVANWVNLAVRPPKLLVCEYCGEHISNQHEEETANYQAMETVH